MPKDFVPKQDKKIGPSLLIVEDDATMREFLEDYLSLGRYQVVSVKDGRQAIKTLRHQQFDVAIVDLRLPGKSGIEVVEKSKVYQPELKPIIITAYPSVETAVEAMKIGAIDYLTKPLDLNNLEKLIRDTLGPVQVEIKPKAITEEAVPKAIAAKETPQNQLSETPVSAIKTSASYCYVDKIITQIA